MNPSEIDLFHHAAFFAFLAAFAFGSSTVFGKRIVNHLDFKSTTALRFGITSLIMLILVLLTGEFFKIPQISGFQWKLFIVIVFTSGATAMFLYYFGLKRVTASVSTICELFWPLSAVVLDYILNKNVLNSIQIIASLILLLCFYKVVSEGQAKETTFVAKVIAGVKRGRLLGFPTANLDKKDLDIPHGVYLVQTKINDKIYQGLLHFGYKETFNEGPSLEIFIKDFSGNLYQKEIEIKVVKKIREVKKFKSLLQLKEQIKKDLQMIN